MAARRRDTERGGTRSNHMLKSIHEGWAYHFTPQSRSWMKRWLVLDGTRVVVFSSERAVVVSLNLGQGTKLKDVILQRNVQGLDIELTTMKGMAESRTDYFGFSTPNECDLWKAYIMGFSYGYIPENLNLLPGQLKDVREAINDVGLAPPPLPLPNKRPSLKNVVPGNAVPRQPSLTVSPVQISTPSPRSSDVSPYSDINISDLGNSPPHSEDEEEVLEKLDRRCADLALKALEKEVEREPAKHGHHGHEPLRSQRSMNSFTPLQQQQQQQQQQMMRSQSLSVPLSYNHTVMDTCNPLSPRKSRSSIFLLNNNELPPFYDDPERNKVPPPWFMNCTREVAEMILTAGRNYGNLFMRPSFNNNASETYVISMRRDLPGGIELRHYAVYRTPDGFKLDVVDKHNPMSCLSDVMNFFIHYVGSTVHPLNSQDVERFMSGITSPAAVVSPKPLPVPHQQFLPQKELPQNDVKPSENVASLDIEQNSQVITLSSENERLAEVSKVNISKPDGVTSPVSSIVTQGKENVSVVIIKSVPDATPGETEVSHHVQDSVQPNATTTVSSSNC